MNQIVFSLIANNLVGALFIAFIVMLVFAIFLVLLNNNKYNFIVKLEKHHIELNKEIAELDEQIEEQDKALKTITEGKVKEIVTGFTELLRTLRTESTPKTPAKKRAPRKTVAKKDAVKK